MKYNPLTQTLTPLLEWVQRELHSHSRDDAELSVPKTESLAHGWAEKVRALKLELDRSKSASDARLAELEAENEALKAKLDTAIWVTTSRVQDFDLAKMLNDQREIERALGKIWVEAKW